MLSVLNKIASQKSNETDLENVFSYVWPGFKKKKEEKKGVLWPTPVQ